MQVELAFTSGDDNACYQPAKVVASAATLLLKWYNIEALMRHEETIQETEVRCSTAYPTGRERCLF